MLIGVLHTDADELTSNRISGQIRWYQEDLRMWSQHKHDGQASAAAAIKNILVSEA